MKSRKESAFETKTRAKRQKEEELIPMRKAESPPMEAKPRKEERIRTVTRRRVVLTAKRRQPVKRKKPGTSLVLKAKART